VIRAAHKKAKEFEESMRVWKLFRWDSLHFSNISADILWYSYSSSLWCHAHPVPLLYHCLLQ